MSALVFDHHHEANDRFTPKGNRKTPSLAYDSIIYAVEMWLRRKTQWTILAARKSECRETTLFNPPMSRKPRQQLSSWNIYFIMDSYCCWNSFQRGNASFVSSMELKWPPVLRPQGMLLGLSLKVHPFVFASPLWPFFQTLTIIPRRVAELQQLSVNWSPTLVPLLFHPTISASCRCDTPAALPSPTTSLSCFPF